MNVSKKIQDGPRTITLSRAFFDISRLINVNMAIYPGDPKPKFEKVLTIENNKVEVTRITIGSHTGTHIDAQKHFISAGVGIDKEPLNKFIGEAHVVDLSKKIVNEGISNYDLDDYSNIVKDDDILLIYTNMDNKIQDRDKTNSFNYLEPSAVEWIVNHKIKCIGIDTFSVEKFGANDGIVHKKLLSNGIGIIENLKSNFAQFANKKIFLICLPLLLENIDASPARAILFEIPTNINYR